MMRFSVAKTSLVEGDMAIEITRVEKAYESVFEEINLDTEYVYTDDIPQGEQEYGMKFAKSSRTRHRKGL